MADYCTPITTKIAWQQPVKDKDLADAPGAPSKGDRYIVASGTTTGDDWFGHADDIATYDGEAWFFATPAEGWQVYVEDENQIYSYNGSNWFVFSYYVNVNSYTDFATAIAAIDTAEATLVIPDVQAVTADISVPATCSLQFSREGALNIANSKTVIIAGSIDADRHQIFTGEGVVSFKGNSTLTEVYPEWWGAIADDSTDNVAAIQACVDAAITVSNAGASNYYGVQVRFASGSYKLGDGSITVTNANNKSIWFVGAGMFSTRLVKNDSATGDLLIWNCGGHPTGIKDLALVGYGAGIDGLSTGGTMGSVYIDNVWFSSFTNGANLDVATNVFISNCTSEHCTSNGFIFSQDVRAVNCESYHNGNAGYYIKYTESPAYPQTLCILNGCRSMEDRNYGIYISSRKNVEINNFVYWSSANDDFAEVAIAIDACSKINITGGNVSYAQEHGILFLNACDNITINGMYIHRIGASVAGVGIELNAACNDISILGVTIHTIRLSGIKTANAGGVQIANSRFVDFGLNETGGDVAGILLDGDISSKGAMVSNCDFADYQSKAVNGIEWESGADGRYTIRGCEFSGITKNIDFANAPLQGVRTEENQGINDPLTALADAAGPSVNGLHKFKTGGETKINGFAGGYEGQIIMIVAEHAVTIDDGVAIFLAGSVDFEMAITDTLTLICKADNYFYEISRSVNG